MAYEHRRVFKQILLLLSENPSISLKRLSAELRVGPRTIQNIVGNMTSVPLKDLRKAALLRGVRLHFQRQRGLSVKQLSHSMGYLSARSFARAVRRASGVNPSVLLVKGSIEQLKMAALPIMAALAADGIDTPREPE